MQNLIYNVFHDIAVRKDAVDDMWGAALASISGCKFPKFDRLHSTVVVLTHNILKDEQK